MYLPGHECALEKFSVMVTLHLLQSAFLHSLLPDKLTEHTRTMSLRQASNANITTQDKNETGHFLFFLKPRMSCKQVRHTQDGADAKKKSHLFPLFHSPSHAAQVTLTTGQQLSLSPDMKAKTHEK